MIRKLNKSCGLHKEVEISQVAVTQGMVRKQRIGQSSGDGSANIYSGDLEMVDGKGMQPAQADSGGSVAPS